MCFQDGGNNGANSPHDADFYANPWKANNDRGDWGKCVPEEAFGVLCVHEDMHGMNPKNDVNPEATMHDMPAQMMFQKLQRLHNDYCVHVDVEINTHTQELFTDYLFGRGLFAVGGPQPGYGGVPGHEGHSAHETTSTSGTEMTMSTTETMHAHTDTHAGHTMRRRLMEDTNHNMHEGHEVSLLPT
jgi:hypothetical protein